MILHKPLWNQPILRKTSWEYRIHTCVVLQVGHSVFGEEMRPMPHPLLGWMVSQDSLHTHTLTDFYDITGQMDAGCRPCGDDGISHVTIKEMVSCYWVKTVKTFYCLLKSCFSAVLHKLNKFVFNLFFNIFTWLANLLKSLGAHFSKA